MSAPNWNNRLDHILKYMREHQSEAVLGRPDDIARKAGLHVERSEAFRMLDYLAKLGYASYPDTTPRNYSITLEGIMFIQKGGFTKQALISKIENFPKRFWWLIGIFTFIVGWLTPILTNQLTKDANNDKKDSSLKIEQPIRVVIDTLKKPK
jgi:hypothetical protein